MTRTPAGTTPTDPTANVTPDMPCVHCGYNLRGLASDGRCPECGLSIAESIRGDALRFANPEWLWKLRIGTVLKLWSVLMLVILIVSSALLPVTLVIPPILELLPPLLCSGLWLWSTYLITTPEPRHEAREQSVNLRRIVRISAILATAGIVIEPIAAMMVREIARVLDAAAAVLTPAWIVLIFSELVYYRRFARRVPSPKLARSSTIILWGLPATLLLGFLGAVVLSTTTTTPAGGPFVSTRLGSILMSVSCVGMAASVYFMIAYIFLLVSFRQEFARAIERRGPDTAP